MRHRMLFPLLALIALSAGHAGAQNVPAAGKCVVKIGGKVVAPETHAIVVPDKATQQEQFAAKDLQAHLELLTGKALPVVADSDAGDRIPLIVGKSALLKKLGVAVDFASLGLEGIHIKTAGPALVLAGNRRGVLYAVYTFLEENLQCRWFTPDCTVLPKEGTFDIARLDRRYVPPLEYRATDYPNSRDGNWAVRNKMNGAQVRADEQRGGNITYKGFVHTFNGLVPPEKYFAAHPEYFSEVGGKRLGPEYTQLCLTNPDVLRIATESVRRWIQEEPKASIVSVSQNDWGNYCRCAKCEALAKKEGSQSGPLLHFVNAIAQAIGKEHPDKIIDTLAYQYTRKPPKFVRPRPNVAVRLCSIECCFAHPLERDTFNKTFVDDIQGWSKICKRLHIWDYVINYAHSICPFPNLYVLRPNIAFFVRNGVTGIYEEANYYSKGGELAELRTYLMAKALWDPNADVRKAMAEFLAGYYGPAAAPIHEYIRLIHRSVRTNPEVHVRIYSPPASYLAPETIARAAELFDEAEKAAAGDPAVLHRVQVARLPVIYAQIALRTSAYREEGDALVTTAEKGGAELVARFEQIARAEGVTHIREGGPLDDWLSRLPRDGASLRLIRLRNPALEATLLPERGGRIWRLRTLPAGKEILKRFGTPEALEPAEGGYEEYSDAGYRSPGWVEVYTVKEQSERAATLEATLKNGLRVTRRIELDPEKPVLKVSTTLTNTGKAVVSASPRVHPAFAVTDNAKATVWLKSAAGKWTTFTPVTKEDLQSENERWLGGADRPAGEWALVDNTDDVGVINRFDTGQVAKCYVNWNGRERRVNLEIFTEETKLSPGQSVTLAHTYEVVRPASGAMDN